MRYTLKDVLVFRSSRRIDWDAVNKKVIDLINRQHPNMRISEIAMLASDVHRTIIKSVRKNGVYPLWLAANNLSPERIANVKLFDVLVFKSPNRLDWKKTNEKIAAYARQNCQPNNKQEYDAYVESLVQFVKKSIHRSSVASLYHAKEAKETIIGDDVEKSSDGQSS